MVSKSLYLLSGKNHLLVPGHHGGLCLLYFSDRNNACCKFFLVPFEKIPGKFPGFDAIAENLLGLCKIIIDEFNLLTDPLGPIHISFSGLTCQILVHPKLRCIDISSKIPKERLGKIQKQDITILWT